MIGVVARAPPLPMEEAGDAVDARGGGEIVMRGAGAGARGLDAPLDAVGKRGEGDRTLLGMGGTLGFG